MISSILSIDGAAFEASDLPCDTSPYNTIAGTYKLSVLFSTSLWVHVICVPKVKSAKRKFSSHVAFMLLITICSAFSIDKKPLILAVIVVELVLFTAVTQNYWLKLKHTFDLSYESLVTWVKLCWRSLNSLWSYWHSWLQQLKLQNYELAK